MSTPLNSRISEISLHCPQCGSLCQPRGAKTICCTQGHCYPVKNSIARFIYDGGYAEPFGMQWLQWSDTQLDTAERDESAHAFLDKTGVKPEHLSGIRVLEVGCGSGRFLTLCVAAGATAAGIDLTQAIDACAENVAEVGEATLAQADLFAPPFKPASFDFVYSLGVLHHTPDTRAAFEAIAPLVRPGGRLSVWVYSREPGDRASAFMGYVYRIITTRLPSRLLMRICEIARPLYRVQNRDGRLAQLLRLALPIAMHPDPDWRVLGTFDFYAPKYRNRHTVAEVVAWFQELGFTDIEVLGLNVSVTGIAPHRSTKSSFKTADERS